MNKTLLLKAFDNFLLKADADFKRYHRIADKMAPKVRRDFLKAVAQAQKGINLKELESLLEAQNFIAAENLIDWTKFSTSLAAININDLAKVFNNATAVASGMFLEDAGLTISFTLPNLEAERWISENGARFVTQVNTESRKAIKETMLRAQREGIAPRKIARELKQHIGLTNKQSEALDNLRTRLEGQRRLTSKQIDGRVTRFQKRLLKRRAENIARTETIRAVNEGQQAIWEQAMAEGLIPPTSRKQFVTAGDERVCPWCGSLDGTIVGMRDNFSITASPSKGFRERNSTIRINARGQEEVEWVDEPVFAPEETATNLSELTAPIHASCRCSMVLVT